MLWVPPAAPGPADDAVGDCPPAADGHAVHAQTILILILYVASSRHDNTISLQITINPRPQPYADQPCG